MAHDIFISYSHKDKPIADAVCNNLESAGFRCWVAPRDIAPGLDWPTAISDAIAASRVMVLLFSTHSNSSKDVSRELILAANNDLVIIPFKLDNIVPESGKQYYLARTHWLDAMNPPTQEQIDRLVGYVRSFLSGKPSADTQASIPAVQPPATVEKEPAPGERPSLTKTAVTKPAGQLRKPAWKRPWIWGSLLAAALIGAGILAASLLGLPSRTASPSAQTTPSTPPTFTPTQVSTSTPSPTAAPTTLPGWVSEFAQPILDLIASRPPTFQDDFGSASSGWQAEEYCGQRMAYVNGELVITNCEAERPGVAYPDYVIEVDGRFLPESLGYTRWALGLRCLSCSFGVDSNNSVLIQLSSDAGEDVRFDFPIDAHIWTQSNHMLMIHKDGRYAFFVNDQPIHSMEGTIYGDNSLSFQVWGDHDQYAAAAFDNLKVWDISDIVMP